MAKEMLNLYVYKWSILSMFSYRVCLMLMNLTNNELLVILVFSGWKSCRKSYYGSSDCHKRSCEQCRGLAP